MSYFNNIYFSVYISLLKSYVEIERKLLKKFFLFQFPSFLSKKLIDDQHK